MSITFSLALCAGPSWLVAFWVLIATARLPWNSILSLPSCGIDLKFPSFTWRTVYKPHTTITASDYSHRYLAAYCTIPHNPQRTTPTPNIPLTQCVQCLRDVSSTARLCSRRSLLQMFSSPKSFKSSVRSAFLAARARARSLTRPLFFLLPSSRAQRSNTRPPYTMAA